LVSSGYITLTKAGAGSLTLSGNSAGLPGPLTVNAGTVVAAPILGAWTLKLRQHRRLRRNPRAPKGRHRDRGRSHPRGSGRRQQRSPAQSRRRQQPRRRLETRGQRHRSERCRDAHTGQHDRVQRPYPHPSRRAPS
jgi:autotransporter-associated beta strand protein